MKKHLAIFSKEEVRKIFSGKKNLDIRLSKRKISPFGRINIGDIVYIKPPGEEVVGQFIVKKVISFERLEIEDWKVLKSGYGVKDAFPSKNPKYATLIFIDQVEQFITSPIKLEKKDLRGWVVL